MTAPGTQFCSVDWAGRLVEIEHQWIEAGPDNSPLLVFLHEGLGSVSMWRDYPQQLCAALGWQGPFVAVALISVGVFVGLVRHLPPVPSRPPRLSPSASVPTATSVRRSASR
mgnify:CR=1 FL=1